MEHSCSLPHPFHDQLVGIPLGLVGNGASKVTKEWESKIFRDVFDHTGLPVAVPVVRWSASRAGFADNIGIPAISQPTGGRRIRELISTWTWDRSPRVFPLWVKNRFGIVEDYEPPLRR